MTRLKVGDKAPEFEALDETGKTIKLSDFKSKKVILFFYPKASTPTCTVEACNLSDNYKKLKKLGYEIIGVSADTAKRQQNFKKKHNFPYPLLADVDMVVIKAFDVWGPKKFMGREFDGIHRTTFVIDENGILEKVIEKVKSKEHAAQILE
ncbi:MAG TPA: thioredoxin-dependent thiol peroxidase [Flavobacteriaceae bacterium]|nr:thioredoxin-dependent thiol peroxidase [Flavobacteriaceae bacterium]